MTLSEPLICLFQYINFQSNFHFASSLLCLVTIGYYINLLFFSYAQRLLEPLTNLLTATDLLQIEKFLKS